MANKFYGAIGFSGGSDGFLDNIDGTNLADVDGAWVIDSTPLMGAYHLDVDSAAVQVIPTIMQPDANAGDRRWLLAGMQMTSIKLYEAGATNLVTMSQSSGNLVIDNTYDTGTITFKGENTGDSTMIVMDPAGSVDLYYGGAKKIETTATGVTITGVSASTTSTSGTYDASTDFTVGSTVITDGVITDATGLQISAALTVVGALTVDGLNLGDNEDITLGAGPDAKISSDGTSYVVENGAGTATMIKATQTGAVELYNNGILTVSTSSEGLEVYDTSGDDPFILFYSDATAIQGYLGFLNGGNFQIYDDVNDDFYIKCNANDSVDLYHDGLKTLGTLAFGVNISEGSTGNAIRIQSIGGDAYFDGKVDDGLLYLRAENVSSTITNLFEGDPNGAATLYYDGTKTLETHDYGLALYAPAVTDAVGCLIWNDGSTWYLESQVHGAKIGLAAENNSGTFSNVVRGDPDSAVEFYYNGTKACSTSADGINIYDTLGDDPKITFNTDVPAETGSIYLGDSLNLVYSVDASGSGHYWSGKNDSGTARDIFMDCGAETFYPINDSVWSLGSSSKCWADIYVVGGVTSCSDEKYKESIQQTALGLEFINDLVPMAYKFRKDGKRPKTHNRVYHGLIAQDLEAVLQDHGITYNDFAGLEESFDEDGDRWLHIKYEQFISPMIKAIQELKAEIDELKKEKK